MLHSVQLLGGKTVSVTTDGFLTDLDDLEKLVKNLYSDRKIYDDVVSKIKVDKTVNGKELATDSNDSNDGELLYSYNTKNSVEVFSLFREFRKAGVDFAIAKTLDEGQTETHDDSVEFYDAFDQNGLEQVTSGVGLISWSTRGQLGRDG